ncbi:hypothetical protein X777_04430, partial [Ooceraea biroi]
LPANDPDIAASNVDTWKSLKASLTWTSVANGCICILARASDIRMTASSCRTVMGIDNLFSATCTGISPSTECSVIWPALQWMFMTCLARVISLLCSCSSLTMNIVSKRDSIVGMKSMFSSPLMSSHRPKTELAAASTEHLVFRVVVMPAFAIEIVCCSIASCIATRSSSFILSNSSMQTTPPSARTIAPPSITKFLWKQRYLPRRNSVKHIDRVH